MIGQMCEKHKDTEATWECSRCKKPKCEKCKSPTGVCKKCSGIISHKRAIGFWIDLTLISTMNFISNKTGTYFLNIIGIFYLLLRDYSRSTAGGKIQFDFMGLSLGKYIVGLKVVTDDTDEKITVIHSIKRNLIYLLPLTPVIEYIIAERNKDHRRIGDKFANTKVIELSSLKRDSMYKSMYFLIIIFITLFIAMNILIEIIFTGTFTFAYINKYEVMGFLVSNPITFTYTLFIILIFTIPSWKIM